MYYVVLYAIILYCVILYYVILNYIMLYYIILYIINQELVSTLPTLASLPTGHILWDMTYFHLLYFIIICHHNSIYFTIFPSWCVMIFLHFLPKINPFHLNSPPIGFRRARLRHPGPISGSFIRNFFRAPKAAPGMMACLDRYFRWKMSFRTVKDVSNICFEHGKSL